MSSNLESSLVSKTKWPKSTFDRMAVIAIVAFICNSFLLGLPFFRLTYDAYTHIFFAMHYKLNLLETWDTRWYGGYDLASYPPLTHQLIALLSVPFNVLTSYKIVQLICFPIFSLGVFRFSRLFVGEDAAFHAGMASIFLTSFAEAAYQWGQLPTLFAMAFMINGMAYAFAYLRFGGKVDLVLGLLCLVMSLSAHHISIVFGMPMFFVATIWPFIFGEWRSDLKLKLAALRRSVIFALLFIVTAFLIFSPFVFYVVSHQVSQTVIRHSSRNNFISDFPALILFFLIPWGAYLFFIPNAIAAAIANRNLRGLGLAVVVLAACGVGGTIPGVKIFLGGMFNILTLDRFTFWATVAILPFVGLALASAQPRSTKSVLYAALVIVYGSYFWWLKNYKFQPEQVSMKPIASFLSANAKNDYRFLTLGFGSQLAWLSALTNAGSVDGLYHTVRSDPVLRDSGIEAIDGAKYYGDHGLSVLLHYLKYQNQYSLKYIFNMDPFYDDLLTKTGWVKTEKKFSASVVLWEKPATAKIALKGLKRSSDLPFWARVIRASYPLLFLICVLCGGVRVVKVFLQRETMELTNDSH